MLYPDVEGTHYFSDHWHHTPLSAIQFSIDGSSLFTGAMESTLLVWDLRSYTHKKIQLRTGSIRSIITSSSTGGTLVLACNTSTLAVVDLLQQRLAHSVDGIEWQSSGVCSGLVVDNWMGRRVVMLTGLPEVLRVCDPLTQQAIYSLHITSQMEVLPKPPRHGILFTGMLRDGRVIVTYESFGGSALPSLLRFWSYDTNVKSHVEAQIIYAPHQSEVVSLQLDKKKDRVFTLSGDAVKCWEEVKAEATDVHQHIQGDSWRNNSSIPSPSKDVASMLVSPDGSLCFVADDSVYVYGIEHCAPGEAWPLLATLYQGVTTSALSSLTLLEEEQILVSFSASTVFLWTLADRNVHTFRHTQPITSMCQFSAHSVLIADEAGVLTEVAATKNNIGTKVGSVKCPTEGRVEHMELLSAAEGRVAMVDHLSGFRVLNVAIDKDTIGVEEMTPGLNNAEQEHPNRLTEFFKNRPAPQDIEAASVIETQRTAQANQWLHTVLHDSAFALAPMSNVLSQYVRKSTTGV
ncbi:NET1-associated nuclear protein 1 (U3 small nucleolar RNA-associated protein 17) [Angomonas deanei]|uniref:Uncharacterized protein n=1 Tax=Angomonas deanei TaxID=59799 RepID=A0A7G2CK81_9TRYP|nr:NET1-associated nuclear protein 1 (U3 small nucleolar RNA-associated protein 17) [Angomonas deanei]CAD2219023.1 hypothetical protein, conserved [Angomonas deanei]|eukprot:EPY37565.1 NET1-associated nuclear protein 1 (U3 small nucleolar RNA-associated protein 17) [Angomonas deanei]